MKEILFPEDMVPLGYWSSVSTGYRQIKAGEFPPGRMISPNRRGWTREEINNWLALLPVARARLSPAALIAAKADSRQKPEPAQPRRRPRRQAASTGPPTRPAA
jgi:predicted DNA-binding transcriptional regulator AlpA